MQSIYFVLRVVPESEESFYQILTFAKITPPSVTNLLRFLCLCYAFVMLPLLYSRYAVMLLLCFLHRLEKVSLIVSLISSEHAGQTTAK
jgi:hypothetical protein